MLARCLAASFQLTAASSLLLLVHLALRAAAGAPGHVDGEKYMDVCGRSLSLKLLHDQVEPSTSAVGSAGQVLSSPDLEASRFLSLAAQPWDMNPNEGIIRDLGTISVMARFEKRGFEDQPAAKATSSLRKPVNNTMVLA